ncbi:hypothetical protein F0562_013510 [Nyssa sinensis]|uniref:Exportin-7/Ran-binding protein 17 TPR repeats domain-containing protein n=1 Tax=Nyssa sinensis TaxID=561372 RepID=A0A5J4ZN55_9ASTE|nr:hypothetical protein F0562_013510 [Nyssa sinensis]
MIITTEYCRLLGRFRVNYQLSELVNVEGYSDWIRLVAEFTSKSLQSWQWASSSVYYLLGLWSRLVTSVPYLKGDAPSLLDEFVPKITEGFITSRFDSVQAGFPDDLSENPLDNVELLQDQLDCFPYLCRFQYESSSLYIINIVEPILQTYTERAQLQSRDNSELFVLESELAWIVHIIAAILKIKQCTGCSTDSQEVIDAELSARVLRLINVTDSGLHSQVMSNMLDVNWKRGPTRPIEKYEFEEDCPYDLQARLVKENCWSWSFNCCLVGSEEEDGYLRRCAPKRIVSEELEVVASEQNPSTSLGTLEFTPTANTRAESRGKGKVISSALTSDPLVLDGESALKKS